MLSIKKGLPVAKILNSKTFSRKDGKDTLIGILTEEELEEMEERPSSGFKMDPYDLYSEEEMKKKLGTKNRKYIKSELNKKFDSGEADREGKMIVVNDGEILPLPAMTNEDESEQEANIRDVIYVSGPSNSGKSTFVSNFLKMYKEVYPDNPVFIFSAVPTDKAFKWLEEIDEKAIKKLKKDEEYEKQFIRIPLDDSFLQLIEDGDEWTTDDLYHCAVIFDDIDVIPDRKIRSAVVKLRDQCLQIGRHTATTTICTSHLTCNHNATKVILAESTKIVLFPRSGSVNQIEYCLSKYCGLSKDQIKEFLNVPSRWCMINKTYPQYIMGKDTCYLVN